MNSFLQKKDQGFTLLELIISVAIIAIIGGIAFVGFVNSRNLRELATAAQDMLSIMRLAQSKALGGEDNSAWGVHFEESQYVLFRGPSYAGSTLTEAYLLPSGIEIANIAFIGGGEDVVFKRITGDTDESGTFDILVDGSSNFIFAVTVEPSGKVSQTGVVPVLTGSRIVDTRHRSFDLGWSIQSGVTLELTFSDPPNPDTVYPVAMAAYFNEDLTRFDWSGTVTVGGLVQALRIHTTALSSADTTLSIDRDCRRNTKKVAIAIITGATRDIATYEQDCTTVTVDAYGGTISEP